MNILSKFTIFLYIIFSFSLFLIFLHKFINIREDLNPTEKRRKGARAETGRRHGAIF